MRIFTSNIKIEQKISSTKTGKRDFVSCFTILLQVLFHLGQQHLIENSVFKMTYRTHALRCRGPEGKFSQAHLHCFLCSSCVRSLCCLNTMGGSRKLQHLSDRHSIIVTRRAMTTNAANANHRNAHLLLIYAIFFPPWYLYSANV